MFQTSLITVEDCFSIVL